MVNVYLTYNQVADMAILLRAVKGEIDLDMAKDLVTEEADEILEALKVGAMVPVHKEKHGWK